MNIAVRLLAGIDVLQQNRLYDESLYDFNQAQPSIWEDNGNTSPTIGTELISQNECEIAIVGGGYTGLSTAYFLAHLYHVDVCVLEAGHIGWGASGRNGGFCTMGACKINPRRMISRFGLNESRRYWRAQADAVKLVREIADIEHIDINAQGDGEFVVAHARAQMSALSKEAKFLKDQLQVNTETFTRDQFLEYGYDSTEQFGAVKLRPGFGLHPLRYAQGLAQSAINHGARIHTHSEVVSWDHSPGQRHVLRTRAASLTAKHVVVACNGFMPEYLHQKFAGRSIPIQSNIIVTRPLTDHELSLHRWQTDCPVVNTRNLFFYYRLLPDKRFLFGARGGVRGTIKEAEEIFRIMQHKLVRLWPHWASAQVTHRWRGLICMNSHWRPAIGRLHNDPSVFYAFGYQGNGVNTSTWAGKQLANWIVDQAGYDNAGRHLPAVFCGMPPKIFPQHYRKIYLRGMLGAYRLLDRIGDTRK